ncbi:hypothetical protein BDZ88DRAFT_421355 [Geranomyces variabilis]|nr:hypothetical protein BDZ88DRAFT_421355 [Geranomyces variabilis]KAJ3143284.1 hypothetical protein HDU90_000041 [Geranomyces variabilis]
MWTQLEDTSSDSDMDILDWPHDSTLSSNLEFSLPPLTGLSLSTRLSRLTRLRNSRSSRSSHLTALSYLIALSHLTALSSSTSDVSSPSSPGDTSPSSDGHVPPTFATAMKRKLGQELPAALQNFASRRLDTSSDEEAAPSHPPPPPTRHTRRQPPLNAGAQKKRKLGQEYPTVSQQPLAGADYAPAHPCALLPPVASGMCAVGNGQPPERAVLDPAHTLAGKDATPPSRTVKRRKLVADDVSGRVI